MADDKIVLTGVEQILGLLEDSSIDQIEKLDFSQWPSLKIKIEGDKYHGTITPELAKSLYDFVYQLKRGYAEIKYGTSNLQRLRKEDVALFDSITFRISEGCSDVISEGLGKIFDAIAQCVKDGFSEMTPKQKMATIVLLASIAAGYFAFDSYLGQQHEQEMARIDIEAQDNDYAHTSEIAEIVRQAATSSERADEAITGFRRHVEAGHRNIVQSVSDADRINYSGRELTEEDIERITHDRPITSDSTTFTEVVALEHVKRLIVRQIVTVSFYSPQFDRQITIQYNMGHLGTRKEERLKEAFFENTHKSVEVEYSAVFNEQTGEFIRGTLVSIGDIHTGVGLHEESEDEDE
ncbi:hypothetical protein [Vreelandella gomseomensis]|uniref:Uncharacterized protein n=1 Tax=Vreelandella gomseomensis TaxID=370766 RepID=A0ABU1G8M8_9GAMM|nr:hypothetical protein [Halomonas gomseomensis]MDR5873791.1 hypothetical protein [Halomonas gomseomensis]